MILPKVSPYFTPWFKAYHKTHNIQAILFDIDGTLVHGKHGLPGASELLELLRKEKFPFLLVTNDANHKKKEKCEILGRRGIYVTPDEMVSAGDPLRSFVNQNHLLGKKTFSIGDLGDYVQTAGLMMQKDAQDIDHIELVIMGEGVHNWHTDLTAALNILRRNPHIHLIAPNPDSYWPDNKDTIGIGAGGKARFVKTILEDAGIKIDIHYLGKPYEPIFTHAIEVLNTRFNVQILPKNCLILGDNLQGDILGAKRFGMQSGLMLTGITHLKMLDSLTEELIPDYIFEKINHEDAFETKLHHVSK